MERAKQKLDIEKFRRYIEKFEDESVILAIEELASKIKNEYGDTHLFLSRTFLSNLICGYNGKMDIFDYIDSLGGF